MGGGGPIDCRGQCDSHGAHSRGSGAFPLAAVGDGMTWLDWAEVVSAGLFAVVVLVAAISVALDNFNLWRRTR